MGDAIDRLSKSLASGASRRAAIVGLLAGTASVLPWTAAAQDKKQRRKQRRRDLKRYLAYCEFWCGEKFEGNATGIQDCIDAARGGNGPCYSATEKGPGHFCLKVKKCGKSKYCCPEVPDDGPVTEGFCCGKGTFCAFINGTSTGEICVS